MALAVRVRQNKKSPPSEKGAGYSEGLRLFSEQMLERSELRLPPLEEGDLLAVPKGSSEDLGIKPEDLGCEGGAVKPETLLQVLRLFKGGKLPKDFSFRAGDDARLL